MPTYFIAMVALLATSLSAFAAEPNPAADGKHLFILSGQSNMRAPLPDAFKESVSQVFGKDKVIVVMHARPSQPIKRWYKNWTPPKGASPLTEKNKGKKPEPHGTIYDALLKRVEKSVKGQPLASVTYIWMQGEADAGSGWGEVYEQSFYGVLEQFKADLKLEKINYVTGRINDHWLTSKGVKDGDRVRAVQVKIGEAHAHGDWVNTDDLNTGVNPWGIYEFDGGHFPTPAYRVLGQRFARKACKLVDPDAKLDDSAFDAVFLDSAEGIESHLAVGKKISGTKPAAGSDGTPPELASLLDGKYGGSEPKNSHWLVFPPTPTGVELLLDLGREQSLTGIGVDLLINRQQGADLPERVIISVSQDGSNYRQVHRKGITFSYNKSLRRKAVSQLKPQPLLVLVDTPAQPARYIKIELENSSSQVMLDEIVVNPIAKSDLIRHRDQW